MRQHTKPANDTHIELNTTSEATEWLYGRWPAGPGLFLTETGKTGAMGPREAVDACTQAFIAAEKAEGATGPGIASDLSKSALGRGGLTARRSTGLRKTQKSAEGSPGDWG